MDGTGVDPRVLSAAGLFDGQSVNDPADDPDLLSGDLIHGLWPVSLPAMQADAALEVLRAGVPDGMGAEMLASIKDAIATGAELTREQMKELGIRVTQGIANRLETEYVAIWFGISP